ncbi:CG31817, partial [Drosophila busckii]
SISGYPSSWNLDEKAPDVMPDDNSLDEVINCDILNRTPYDHQLYSYVMQRRLRPTADNSCQVCMKTVVDRVFHATNTIAAQTEQADPAEFASELSIDNDDCDYSPQLIPQQRVYSGGADATSVSSASCCCLANDDELSEAESNAASKSNRYKKYGGYTPSDLSSRTSAHSIEGHVCFCDQDKFNKIQKISRPPSN